MDSEQGTVLCHDLALLVITKNLLLVVLVSEEVESTASIIARIKAVRSGGPAPPSREAPQASPEETLARSIETIIALVSKTVEVMEIQIPISMRVYIRNKVYFPRLTDLSSTIFLLPPIMIGHSTQTDPLTYPQLRRWHITDCLQPLAHQALFRTLNESTPSLTHLRLSRIRYDPDIGKAVALALGQAPLSTPPSEGRYRVQSVPPSVKKLYIQIASPMKDMEELAARRDDRFVLLKNVPIKEQAGKDPIADWEAAIYGEEGCWRQVDGNSAF